MTSTPGVSVESWSASLPDCARGPLTEGANSCEFTPSVLRNVDSGAGSRGGNRSRNLLPQLRCHNRHRSAPDYSVLRCQYEHHCRVPRRPRDRLLPEALAKQPEQQTALAHGLSQGLGGTSFLAHLDPTIAAPFLNAFAHAMDLTALVAAAVAAAGFVLSLVVHEQPLRTMSAEVAGKPNLAAQRTATTN